MDTHALVKVVCAVYIYSYGQRVIMLSYPPDIGDCTTGTHLCDQICSETSNGSVCSCNPGYTLDRNGRTCNGELQQLQQPAVSLCMLISLHIQFYVQISTSVAPLVVTTASSFVSITLVPTAANACLGMG